MVTYLKKRYKDLGSMVFYQIFLLITRKCLLMQWRIQSIIYYSARSFFDLVVCFEKLF
jgi:hypothetical protein